MELEGKTLLKLGIYQILHIWEENGLKQQAISLLHPQQFLLFMENDFCSVFGNQDRDLHEAKGRERKG